MTKHLEVLNEDTNLEELAELQKNQGCQHWDICVFDFGSCGGENDICTIIDAK